MFWSQARRVGHSAIQEVTRKVLLTYWNTASFLSLYTRLSNYKPGDKVVERNQRPEIDQWLLSLVDDAVLQVTQALENFDTQKAGRVLSDVVDDMSNWYVRRNRRRFWDGEPVALATLHEALRTITLLMAPFVPFITERVWQDMFKTTTDSSLQSVHLGDWPAANKEEIRTDLIENMGLIRRLVELGRGARAEGKVKNRQPLSRALVSAKILDVQSLSQTGDLVNVAVKANFRTLGARYAKETPAIAKEITNLDATSLVKDLRDNNKTIIKVSGQDFEITAEDVIITETPREGWSVMSQDGETIALDLEISAELRSLGISREVIRMIQEARKTSGLEVSDRINLEFFTTDAQVLESVKQNIEVIKSEVLALKFEEQKGSGAATTSDEDLKLEIWINKA